MGLSLEAPDSAAGINCFRPPSVSGKSPFSLIVPFSPLFDFPAIPDGTALFAPRRLAGWLEALLAGKSVSTVFRGYDTDTGGPVLENSSFTVESGPCRGSCFDCLLKVSARGAGAPLFYAALSSPEKNPPDCFKDAAAVVVTPSGPAARTAGADWPETVMRIAAAAGVKAVFTAAPGGMFLGLTGSMSGGLWRGPAHSINLGQTRATVFYEPPAELRLPPSVQDDGGQETILLGRGEPESGISVITSNSFGNVFSASGLASLSAAGGAVIICPRETALALGHFWRLLRAEFPGSPAFQGDGYASYENGAFEPLFIPRHDAADKFFLRLRESETGERLILTENYPPELKLPDFAAGAETFAATVPGEGREAIGRLVSASAGLEIKRFVVLQRGGSALIG